MDIVVSIIGAYLTVGLIGCYWHYRDRKLIKDKIINWRELDPEMDDYVWAQYVYVLIFWVNIVYVLFKHRND